MPHHTTTQRHGHRRGLGRAVASIGTAVSLLATSLFAAFGGSSCSTTVDDGARADAGDGGGAGDDGSASCSGDECPAPRTCNAACDCAPTGQGCKLGTCAPANDTCEENTDCSCDRRCATVGTELRCVPRCHADSDCAAPTAFCYLPMGICGGCINDAQCGAGGHCLGGVCGPGGDDAGPPTSDRCDNSSQCGVDRPVCYGTPGASGTCESCYNAPTACGDGYFCHVNDCVHEPDAGAACARGCTGGLTCDATSGACVPTTCHPSCGSPARCDPATSQCVCDPDCGGACTSTEICDPSTCTCVANYHRDTPDAGPGCGGNGGEGCPCPFCLGCAAGLTCRCPIGGDTCSITSSCYGTVVTGICRP